MDSARQNGIYQSVKKRFPSLDPQPGFLHSEILLQNGKAVYRFEINQNTGTTVRTSENRLNQNDAFVASHVALLLKREDLAKPGNGRLQNYPNATVFADEATYLLNADLEAFWASKLKVKVGSRVFAEGLDMSLCTVVNTTQQSSATTKSEKGSWDGYIPLDPIITFDGADKNELDLTIANWAGQLIQNSTSATGVGVYGVLKFYGFLVTGGGHISQ